MQGLCPQKTVPLSGLTHLGENIYSIEGVEVPASNAFTEACDRIIGIDSRQRKGYNKLRISLPVRRGGMEDFYVAE